MAPPRIWLVGADVNMASVLSGELLRQGYIVEQIPENAVEFGGDAKPPAIVLSVVNSGMPGLSVLVNARKAVPPVPVVVLIAPDQARIAVEALKCGATDALVTPVDYQELASVLRSIPRVAAGASEKSKAEPMQRHAEDAAVFISRSSHFLKRHRDALASSVEALPPELLDAFMQYHWPGNVRQLENTIRRYLIFPEMDLELNPAGGPASSEPPKRAIAAAAAAASSATHIIQFPAPTDSISLKKVSSDAAERAERELVLHVLEQTDWNRSKAARRLNICYRALLKKLKRCKSTRLARLEGAFVDLFRNLRRAGVAEADSRNPYRAAIF